MRRRKLLTAALTAPLLSRHWPTTHAKAEDTSYSRVRPGDPGWPSDAKWNALNRDVEGRLSKVRSPLTNCQTASDEPSCDDVFRELRNPYYNGDEVALTQTCGWIDAWTAQPSIFAVAAKSPEDVAAAINFARSNRLRLVVKGGGHSYLGTSNAQDSLLIWTRAMNEMIVHDDFVAKGCEGFVSPGAAVSVGSGAIWMHTYNEVTTRNTRFVQGGGCVTVGVAGLLLGGGFGSYSKAFGTAAAGLLEAEIVTADGRIRLANPRTNPDLYWALQGGGGGSFGVVTRLTLRTHELPTSFGVAFASIQASSDAAFRRLIGGFLDLYNDRLFNSHWGGIVTVRPRNRLDIGLESQGVDEARASAIWLPFFGRIADAADDFSFITAPSIHVIPPRHRWDPAFLKSAAPSAVRFDDRPGAAADNMFWSYNGDEVGHFLHGFESAWLPASLLRADRRDQLADALTSAARLWPVELHFQKGLAGASEQTLSEVRKTATNPAVLEAFALAIIAGEGPAAYPGLRGHEPDLVTARRDAGLIADAMMELRKVAPDAGSYVAESSFFEADWQRRYWGPNYDRLRAVKRVYDPEGLFFVHHGVGAEDWSADGFTRVGNPERRKG